MVVPGMTTVVPESAGGRGVADCGDCGEAAWAGGPTAGGATTGGSVGVACVVRAIDVVGVVGDAGRGRAGSGIEGSAATRFSHCGSPTAT
jgi:hypothetical protein